MGSRKRFGGPPPVRGGRLFQKKGAWQTAMRPHVAYNASRAERAAGRETECPGNRC